MDDVFFHELNVFSLQTAPVCEEEIVQLFGINQLL